MTDCNFERSDDLIACRILKKTEENLAKHHKKEFRVSRSFSQPETKFFFNNKNVTLSCSPTDRISASPFMKHMDPDDQCQKLLRCNTFEKAQQFFADSGILGPSNHSPELIIKTSRIQFDPDVKNHIRKKSLGLWSKNFGEPLPNVAQKCTSLEVSQDLIIKNLYEQVNTIKESIETGDTKIIMLRAEINEIKKMLQNMIYSKYRTETKLFIEENSELCVFCQSGLG